VLQTDGSLKYRTQKSPKIPHLCTIAQLCRAVYLQQRHVSTIGKKAVEQQYLFHVSSQYGELGPLTAEIGLVVMGTPANFSGFASCHRYCSDIAHPMPTKLCTMFGRVLGWHTIYTLSGALASDAILPRAKSFYVQVLSSYIGSVAGRHSSSGRQPNFAAWYKEWNYETFTDGATYIRLGVHHVGISPYSSSIFNIAHGYTAVLHSTAH